MSKVKIKGNASGTGVLTIEAPNTNTDRTITLPDGTGELIQADGSGNVGIGVTPESWGGSYVGLDIGTQGSLASYTSSPGGSVLLSRNAYYDGSYKYKNTDEASQIDQTGAGTIKFKVAPSGTADSAISWTTALEITNDGRGLSQFTAKAWANFNGTNTSDVRATHNVSSITDVAVGRWKVNFTNNLANWKVCQVWMSGEGGSNSGSGTITNDGSSTSYMAGSCRDHNNSNLDRPYITAIAFGD